MTHFIYNKQSAHKFLWIINNGWVKSFRDRKKKYLQRYSMRTFLNFFCKLFWYEPHILVWIGNSTALQSFIFSYALNMGAISRAMSFIKAAHLWPIIINCQYNGNAICFHARTQVFVYFSETFTYLEELLWVHSEYVSVSLSLSVRPLICCQI